LNLSGGIDLNTSIWRDDRAGACEAAQDPIAKGRQQPAEAKEKVAHKEDFYNRTMLVGDFKGESVQDAKPKVRDAMIKAGLAFAYAEPESLVITRSNDECVVAPMDQWYLVYRGRVEEAD
jgi:leucyl-tRNA synthetase